MPAEAYERIILFDVEVAGGDEIAFRTTYAEVYSVAATLGYFFNRCNPPLAVLFE